MRVIFLSYSHDGTGWARGAIEYMGALSEVGVEVASRPIKLNQIDGEIPERIKTMEENQFDQYDAVIQCLLPHHMSYNGRFPRNIGLCFIETNSLGRTEWADQLNLMDEVWTPGSSDRAACWRSKVVVPTRTMPIPCNVSRYERSYKPLPLKEELGGDFIFYTIGEFNRRKNLRALLTAFHCEFHVDEPVSLLIKVPKDAQQVTTDYCNGIKAGLKLYDRIEHYKKEIILPGYFTDEEILRLHTSCDCGVFPSYGESWSLPAMDSMALGKTPIVPDWGGFQIYMNNECGWMISCNEEPVFGTQLDTFPDLHTAREDWASINIRELQGAMREAYTNKEVRQQKGLAGIDRAYDFTYKIIGEMMANALRI